MHSRSASVKCSRIPLGKVAGQATRLRASLAVSFIRKTAVDKSSRRYSIAARAGARLVVVAWVGRVGGVVVVAGRADRDRASALGAGLGVAVPIPVGRLALRPWGRAPKDRALMVGAAELTSDNVLAAARAVKVGDAHSSSP